MTPLHLNGGKRVLNDSNRLSSLNAFNSLTILIIFYAAPWPLFRFPRWPGALMPGSCH